MNKKFATFFSNNGLVITGKNSACGKFNGYETNAIIDVWDTYQQLKFHISFYATPEQKQNITTEIRKEKLRYIARVETTPYGIFFALRASIKKVETALNKIVQIISSNGALNAEFCPVCGNRLRAESSKTCKIYGGNIVIDDDCVEKINYNINLENKQFEEAPNNYLKGFLGAIIGALAGAAISVILNLIGYISALSAFVAIILGAFLYQKLGGKPNKSMIAIVSLTSLAFLLATIPIIYISAAGIAASSEGLSISAIQAFKICMQDGEFSRMFYGDLILTFIFSAISAGFEIYWLSRKIARPTNI